MNQLKLLAGFLLFVAVWPAVLRNWRRGLELFILFTPFSGAVELFLYPAPWPVLIKDVLFVMPAYIGFAISEDLGSVWSGLPRSFGALLWVFIGIVLLQALNPAGPGLLATLIGLKVWLFYVPMLLLGRAYVRDRASLLRLSRLMIGLIWFPCTIGILQWLLSLALGYEYVLTLFYGAAAPSATQGFSHFNVGLMRIPATFAFAGQYFIYVLCMFVPVLGCIGIETDPRWRTIRSASLWLLCVAGFMTGERAAFVMIPLLLFTFYMLRRRVLGLLWGGLLIAGLFAVTLSISGIDLPGLTEMETDLTLNYSRGQLEEIADALRLTWVGVGVGTSTGAARFAASDPDVFVAFEGAYAKAVAELGIAGCAILIALQVVLLLFAVRMRERSRAFASYCGAIATFVLVILIYNYKGPVIALDPGNMLYWLFAGVLFSLPEAEAIDAQSAGTSWSSDWVETPRGWVASGGR
jgi:hypothetical protein